MDGVNAAFHSGFRMNAGVRHVQSARDWMEAVSVCSRPGACVPVATPEASIQRLKHERRSAVRGAQNPVTAFSRRIVLDNFRPSTTKG